MAEEQIINQVREFCRKLLPRMLTQVCRDPGSPVYGSFDRNWWHYKIRDFSSIILQQGGYALYCAAQWDEFSEIRNNTLNELAAGTCRFWNLRAKKFRAFEEYYPWEEGYPPLAFSTLAVAKLAAAGVIETSEILDGLSVAAKQLQRRFESKATNQQVAGTAALCWIRKIAPQLIDADVFRNLCDRTLACQHPEGWYMEYGGPDLGYLSVTMDCLWDAFDATGDERFRRSAAQALEFIAPFVLMPQRGAGMHNARNTDYIVPYGIARFLEDPERKTVAMQVLRKTLEGLEDPDHFLYAIDDRYFCHYIGHSFFRAVQRIIRLDGPEVDAESRFFPGTGHWLCPETASGCAAIVSGKKGGVLTLDFSGKRCADFGWIISVNGREWVSHWWGDFWKIARDGDWIQISGYFTPHAEHSSSPIKHLVLRALSLVFGRRIISLLKEKMIFKEKDSHGPSFQRSVRFTPDGVEVVDLIGAEPSTIPVRAPRSSKRHVASADSCHREDICPVDPEVEVRESRSSRNGCVCITTVYRRKK